VPWHWYNSEADYAGSAFYAKSFGPQPSPIDPLFQQPSMAFPDKLTLNLVQYRVLHPAFDS
jgi:hypothetical protein